MALQARFFDGLQSRPKTVTLAVSETALRLTPDDGTPAVLWRFDDIILLDKYDRSHPGRLSVRHTPDARLLIDSAAGWRAIAPHLVSAKNHGASLSASWGTLAAYAVLAALLVVLVAHYVPRGAAHLAVFVPDSAADSLGRQVVASHFKHPVCVEPAGLAAFAKLRARLESGLEMPLAYKPVIVKNAQTNAFASPGHYVVVFSGLIDGVGSMDEFAGVLAHELGHVHYNHPMRSMMRYMGFSFIMTMMVGDSRVMDAAGLMNAMRFSRTDEAVADDFAIGVLQRAGLNALLFAGFFERLDGKHGKSHAMLEYMSSHPASAERIKVIRAKAVPPSQDAAPALSAAEWESFKKICSETMPMEEWLQKQDSKDKKE
ncbi:MAG: M48 family metallopeptidase [Alphaproteobacteria bacterium]|nr:M48 family metallopeptidase [Alphaproteobacteria bacterium]